MELHKSESKFRSLYKSTAREGTQETRRSKLLQEQRKQRSQLLDGLRDLHLEKARPTTGGSPHYKRPSTYKARYDCEHSLQLSEWLREKPADLEEQWWMVAVPKGQRCMVVVSNGHAEMYSKAGRFVCSFRATLPGLSSRRQDWTLLDCVYEPRAEVFYVLDALAYGNQDFLNCEAQFRFFWLTSKFAENPANETSDYHHYAFEVLKYQDLADREASAAYLSQHPPWPEDGPELDGFMFYHKEASYTCGTTPLVGWLFAYMLPEVLGFPVNPAYMDSRPDDYVDYLHFMTEFDEELRRKASNRRRSNTSGRKMDEDHDDDESLLETVDMENDLELSNEIQ